MRSALSILAETGRTDFTVLEVVERSKTSLRSFYQHFSTKDEGVELSGAPIEGNHIYEFCVRGLLSHPGAYRANLGCD